MKVLMDIIEVGGCHNVYCAGKYQIHQRPLIGFSRNFGNIFPDFFQT